MLSLLGVDVHVCVSVVEVNVFVVGEGIWEKSMVGSEAIGGGLEGNGGANFFCGAGLGLS